MPHLTVLVPDLDDDLTIAMTRVEEVLLTLSDWEENPDVADELAPLGYRRGLAALSRLWDPITQTQTTRRAATTWTGRQYAPDGHYEHIPLRPVNIERRDTDAFTHTAVALADPCAPELVRDAITQHARANRIRPEDLAGTGKRIAALLAITPDAALLRRITDTPPHTDIVFTPAEEAAYQRHITAANQAWTSGNPADRWAY